MDEDEYYITTFLAAAKSIDNPLLHLTPTKLQQLPPIFKLNQSKSTQLPPAYFTSNAPL